jgi:hypothetical protein
MDMLAPVEGQGFSRKPAALAPDVATCILALIASLSGMGGHTVEGRNGELFITPVQPCDDGDQHKPGTFP